MSEQKFSRQEELGKRLVAMMRLAGKRKEELRTWELAKNNCTAG